MEKRWEFDKVFIEKLLVRINKLLSLSSVSQKSKNCLLKDKITLESFLDKDFFRSEEENIYAKKDLEQLIDITLYYMREFYRLIGKDLMDWIIELNNSKIFPFYDDENLEEPENITSYLTIDEQAELTLKNYEKNSKLLLPEAKKLIYDMSQIQVSLDDGISSFSHQVELVQLPFIVINPKDGFSVLNHEVDHGLHYYLGNRLPRMYSELSSILNEILCMDLFTDIQGELKLGDISWRFEEVNTNLEALADFFMLIKEFSKKDFKVSCGEFIETCEKLIFVSEESLEEYLVDEILAVTGIEESMIYSFSYLKAIELRNKFLLEKEDNLLNVLKPYFSKRKFKFDINPNAFNIYNNYVEEMSSRVRKH